MGKTNFFPFVFDLLRWNMVKIMLSIQLHAKNNQTKPNPRRENIVVDSTAWQSEYLNFFP